MGSLNAEVYYNPQTELVKLPGPSMHNKLPSPQDLTIFHQNIRSLYTKTDEIWQTFESNLPQVLCFTEHHLKTYQIDNVFFQNYQLGATFCREKYKNGGVCIYVHETLRFSKINTHKFCQEKDIEFCAIKLHLCHSIVIILSIYRSPSGNFDNFFIKLEAFLNDIKAGPKNLIICGDFNIDFSSESTHKQLLNSLLATYGLSSTVQFPTRINSISTSALDNIFINTRKCSNYKVYPIVNGLSDHDAQIIILHDIPVPSKTSPSHLYRKIDSISISDFNLKLSHESWGDVFSHNDINTDFNNF
jgi:exonuclease III